MQRYSVSPLDASVELTVSKIVDGVTSVTVMAPPSEPDWVDV
jgi:hypothetical protein